MFPLAQAVRDETEILEPAGAGEEKYRECFEILLHRVAKAIEKIEEE